MKPMKVRIGYTNNYIEIEDPTKLNKLDNLLEDLKLGDIYCSFCKVKIIGDDWQVIVHNPKEDNIPVRIHFFHFSKECARKWSEVGLKDRKKLVTGEF